jgi:hypothetical protein
MRLGRTAIRSEERGMDGKVVVVETGLVEEVEWRGKTYLRHARTRFVEKAAVKPPAPPEAGDPWEPLTVRATLHRMADTFRKLPHSPDTRPGGYRSCMPEIVREIFKDQPGEPMRLPVRPEDLRAAMILLDIIVSLTDEQRIVLWGIATKRSDRRVARELRCDHKTAAAKKQRLLTLLSERLNRLAHRPDDRDVERARELIHRNIK